MKPQYAPKTFEAKVAYLIEESGETIAAVGKSLRWGWYSVNPELRPASEQETNRDWVLRELDDLESAIYLVREGLHRMTKP